MISKQQRKTNGIFSHLDFPKTECIIEIVRVKQFFVVNVNLG